jgi:hypothetical protein
MPIEEGSFFPSLGTALTRQALQMRYDQATGAGVIFDFASDFEPGGLLSIAAALFISLPASIR